MPLPRARPSAWIQVARSGNREAGSGWQEQQVHRDTTASKPETCDTSQMPGGGRSRDTYPTAQRVTLCTRGGVCAQSHIRTRTQHLRPQLEVAQWVGTVIPSLHDKTEDQKGEVTCSGPHSW